MARLNGSSAEQDPAIWRYWQRSRNDTWVLVMDGPAVITQIALAVVQRRYVEADFLSALAAKIHSKNFSL
jgi:predicted phosphoadenosine phosphosulfate sulfurtransferase